MEAYVSCRVAAYSLRHLDGKVSGASIKRALADPEKALKIDFQHALSGSYFTIEDAHKGGAVSLNVRYNQDRGQAVIEVRKVWPIKEKKNV